jgi:hypothetical protein
MSTANAQIGAQGSAWTNVVSAGSAITGRITDSYPYTTGGYNGMIVFRGMVEVEKAANGFVVRLGTRQGDVATTYVAKDVAEVNGIITAEMVKFRLEDK